MHDSYEEKEKKIRSTLACTRYCASRRAHYSQQRSAVRSTASNKTKPSNKTESFMVLMLEGDRGNDYEFSK